MSRKLIFRSLLVSLLFTIATMGVALALTGGKYLPETRVPLVQARKLALKAFRGKIVSEELEKESGGSGLRYSFVIRRRDKETRSRHRRQNGGSLGELHRGRTSGLK